MNQSEISGSHQIATPVTVPAQVGHLSGFDVNIKTIVMILVLFAGGSVGGGGVSLFTGPRVMEEIKEEVQKSSTNTNNKIDQLAIKIGAMNDSIVDVKADLKISNSEFQRHAVEFKDLKERVDALEGRRRR